ncbi:ABC transporter permease [Streptomyces sp. NPDC051776]|uniref:ABC transporter permease n=1 Tax=Streptomyces sp. NPDC051776 TaxID=3155414 RepID=UPI00343A5E64
MTVLDPLPAATSPRRSRNGPITIGLARGGLEIRQFVRAREALFFTLLFPLLMLVLFGSIFHGDAEAGVPIRQVLVSGMIASGVMGASFQTLGVAVAAERHDGTLKRLRGLPMPPSSYFVGKILLVLTITTAQLAVMLAVGTAFFGLHLPDRAGNWMVLAWVTVLGSTSCSLLGIAVSGLARSAKAAAPVITIPFIALQFISGVFFPFSSLPEVLQRMAALFPLKWMIQGMHAVFLPSAYQSAEPAGTWELARVALILGFWALGALALCTRTFRWDGRRGR